MKTDRIDLIPVDKNDFEVFQDINTNCYVRKYLWDDKIMPEELFRQILNEVELHFDKDDWGLWKIISLESSSVIGYVGLWLFFDEHQPQLLYALRPEYTGKGYATESARLIIDYAFSKLKFEHLVATMDKENIASQKVCERLAFRFIEEREVDGKHILFYRLNHDVYPTF